jgi:hypothetical protein
MPRPRSDGSCGEQEPNRPSLRVWPAHGDPDTPSQIGHQAGWLPGPGSLGQGTAAIGPVAAGRLAQTPSACIPCPRLPSTTPSSSPCPNYPPRLPAVRAVMDQRAPATPWWPRPATHPDSERTSRTGKFSGKRNYRLLAARQVGYWTRSELLVWGGAPAGSNRRPHPYHGTTGNRCVDRHLPRSRSTVGAKVMGSASTQVCVHSLQQSSEQWGWGATASPRRRRPHGPPAVNLHPRGWDPASRPHADEGQGPRRRQGPHPVLHVERPAIDTAGGPRAAAEHRPIGVQHIPGGWVKAASCLLRSSSARARRVEMVAARGHSSEPDARQCRYSGRT